MRFAIVGAGAMGGIVGAALAEGGADVVLVDVSSTVVERINEHGLTVERDGSARTVRIPATLDAREVGHVDAVVFFVKCYHSDAAATLAEALVGPDTTVATLQNGWGNGDVLARHFPAEQIVIGVTYHSGTLAAPGHVLHTNTSDAPTYVGPFDGDELNGAEALAAALARGGFRADARSDIRTEIWKKLVLNSSALPTSALTRSTAGNLAQRGEMHELIDGLIAETVAVGRAQGLDIDESERLEAVHGVLAGAGRGKASMLQDIEGGRRTEIDVINGAVVRVAREVGVDVPLNRAMVALIKGYEVANGLLV
jgi:2-dehydropantoate 2-reductase